MGLSLSLLENAKKSFFLLLGMSPFVDSTQGLGIYFLLYICLFACLLTFFVSRYFRRYTNYFGRDGENASKIAIHALSTYKSWISDIEKWQTPILEDKNLPNWYKQVNKNPKNERLPQNNFLIRLNPSSQALFNELYYLVEGGSIWVGDRVSSESDVLKSQMAFVPEIPEKETYKTVGKFGLVKFLEEEGGNFLFLFFLFDLSCYLFLLHKT